MIATDGPAAARLLGESVEDPGSRSVACRYFSSSESPVQGPWLVLNGDGEDGVFVCGDWLESASLHGALLSGRTTAEAILQDR